MSIKVMSYIWEHSQTREGSLLVLLAIGDFSDDHGKAYPSVNTLAKKARLSIRQTQYCLKSLVDSGELGIEQNKGPHGCNLYRVQLLRGAITAGGAICSNDNIPKNTDIPIENHSVNEWGAITAGVQCSAPKPSIEPSIKKQRSSLHPIPEDFKISDSVRTWAAAHGFRDLEARLSHFIDWAIAGEKKYANWDATFRNAIRGNWAGLSSTNVTKKVTARDLVC